MYKLPWTHMLSLTAPPGLFPDYWSSWAGLNAWTKLGNPRRPEFCPFFLYVFADHEAAKDPKLHPFRADNKLHAHILVGGVPYPDVKSAADSWPGIADLRPVPLPGFSLKERSWGALHYLIAQEKNPWRHAQDVNSYCLNLLQPPKESWNLLYLQEHQRARRAGRRASRGGHARAASLSAGRRREIAIKAARSRWK